MKVFCILVAVLVLASCGRKEYIKVTHCPPEHHKTIVNFMAECGSSVSTCDDAAKMLFCDTKFIRNPNYDSE